MNTIIVQGPKGCGKTRYAEEIRNFYGCKGIIDGWQPEIGVVKGHVHLTNAFIKSQTFHGALVIDFAVIVNRFKKSMTSAHVSEKIVCREIGRSTVQGPESEVARLVPNAEQQPRLPSAQQADRLIRLMEECSEVQQEAAKILRFGFDSFQPEDPTRELNRDRLRREMIDLKVAWDMMCGMGEVNSFGFREIAAVHKQKAGDIGGNG